MSLDTLGAGDAGQQFIQTTNKIGTLGRKMIFPDGRTFRYCLAGGSLTAGRLIQSEAAVANLVNENFTIAGVAGDRTATVDVNTLPALDAFEDGYLVNETQGITLGVSGNTSADPTVLTFASPDGLPAAVPISDVVSMFKSGFRDVVVKIAAAATAPVIGVSVLTLASGSFGWVQSSGVCGVLVEDTLTLGDAACVSALNDAGAVSASLQTSGEDAQVGIVLEIGANTEVGTIFLTID